MQNLHFQLPFLLLWASSLILISCTKDRPRPDTTPNCQPKAAFSVQGDLIVDQEVTFVNQSDANSRKFEWILNGELKSSEKEFVFTFTSIGNYEIKLIALCGDQERGEVRYKDSITQEITIQSKPLDPNASDINASITKIGDKVLNSIPGDKLEPTCEPCSFNCELFVQGISSGVYKDSFDNIASGYISVYIKPLVQNGKDIPDANWFVNGSKIPDVDGKWRTMVYFGSIEDPVIDGDLFQLVVLISSKDLSQVDNISKIDDLGRRLITIEVKVKKACYDPCLIDSELLSINQILEKPSPMNPNPQPKAVNNNNEVRIKRCNIPPRPTLLGDIELNSINFDRCDPLYIHTLIMGPDESNWHIQDPAFPIGSSSTVEWNIISQLGTERPRHDTAKVGDVFMAFAIISPYNEVITDLDTIPKANLEDFKQQYDVAMGKIINLVVDSCK